MSISSASELESSLMGFAGSDSSLTWQGGDKRKRRRREGWGRLFGGGDNFKYLCLRGAIFRGRRLTEGRLLGTLRFNDATAEKTSLKKWICFLQSLSQLFLPTYFVKCMRTLLELNSKGPYPSSERATSFCPCLFMYSIKREIRHFNVVVVQKRVKKCTNERDVRAKLLFWL